MRKESIIGLLFIVLVTLALLSGCTGEKANTIKIALVCPLTGDLAAMGQGMKRAATMAIEEANTKGSVDGFTFALAAFDDRADPKEAVNIANQIISDDKIYGVVGHLNSGCSIPASQIYARKNLVMITPASTNPKLTAQGLKNVFRVCTTDDIQGGQAAEFVFTTLKKNKVAVIHDKTAYGQGVAENFYKRFAELGGEVVSFDGIDVGDKDFKALLTAIKTEKPQLLYFGGVYTECALLSKQVKELGLNIPVFSDDGSFSTEYIKIAGTASEGNYFSMVGASPDKIIEAKEFLEKFKAKYSGIDMQPYDVYTYEAAHILLEAIAQTKRATQNTGTGKSKIADYIAHIKYKGILGETSFDSNGDTLNKTISIYKVKDGAFVFEK